MADSPDPAVTEAPPPLPPPPRRSPILPLVAGGAIAAALGFAAAQYLPLTRTDTTDLQAKLDAQFTELATLKSQLYKLPAADKSLSDRLASLESDLKSSLESRPETSPDLTARLDALDATVAALKSAPAGTASTADPIALAALQLQIDALKQGGIPAAAIADANAALDAKLAEADTRLATITATAEGIARASTQRAALRQLQSALDSGAPYAAALADLGDLTVPAILADHDATGLPSLQSLRATFPDAARAALDAALKANMGESWSDRVATFLRGQSGARSLIPRDGTDPDAVLSRAEAALTTGDLATALTEAAALPPEAQAAMADWLAQATLRQDATLAVQSLVTAAGL